MDKQYTLEFIQSFIRRQQNRKMETTLPEKDIDNSSNEITTKSQSQNKKGTDKENTQIHDVRTDDTKKRDVKGATGDVIQAPWPPDEAPSGEKQRQIIMALEGEEESMHVYCVAKHWHENWKSYVGINDTNKPVESDRPGPLCMDSQDEAQNTFIDEKIWLKWLAWYGIHAEHELDRRNWASDDKQFEICILNPYSGIVQNPTKAFDISEQTGYVELQLRTIFRVAKHRQTRLWTCEKARSARFHLVLDRTRELCFQDGLDPKREYILALEIACLDGTWPTHVPGCANGTLERYDHVTRGMRSEEYWEQELAGAVNTVFSGIGAELQETVSGIVNTTKCITMNKETDLNKAKEKVETKLKHISETQSKLDTKVREITKQEDIAKEETKRAKKERDKLESERKKFESEMKRMEAVNKMENTRVKLDIGGHTYMTSTMTLTRDPESMLAAMFSGRHALTAQPDNSYFIDRDGTHFRYILNYLRDGGFREGTLPKDRGVLNELLTEAEYYQITGLITLLTDIIARLDDREEEDSHPIRPNPISHAKRPTRKIAIKK